MTAVSVCKNFDEDGESCIVVFMVGSNWGERERAPPLMMSTALASVRPSVPPSVLVRLADCACAIFT